MKAEEVIKKEHKIIESYIREIEIMIKKRISNIKQFKQVFKELITTWNTHEEKAETLKKGELDRAEIWGQEIVK